MGQPATLQLKVRHYELDPYGHVNHAHYVHYFEAARIEALEAIGLSLPEMRRQGYVIFAVELNVKYLAPARAAVERHHARIEDDVGDVRQRAHLLPR